jgi:hypothetical protein
MELAAKLQLKSGQGVEAILVPGTMSTTFADLTRSIADEPAALLVFVTDQAALEKHRHRIVNAVNEKRLTWVAYPKAGRLGTDLNRDALAALLNASGVQPVRQIAVDDVWSALRFRPND